MEKNDQYYDREKLYKEIWETTMIDICKQYGITHAELIEVCKKLNIPRPHVGYWTQKECGKNPLPPELPVFDDLPSLLIHPPNLVKSIPRKSTPKPKIDTDHVSGSKVQAADIVPEPTPAPKVFRWQEHVNEKEILVPEAFEEAGRLIEKEWLPEMAIKMPQMTEKEHPYIKNTRTALEKKIGDFKKYPTWHRYGKIQSHGKDLFEVNVGPDSIQRALGILQALCTGSEKRGFELISEWNENSQYGHIYMIIMGQKIAFSLTEQSIKTELKAKDKNTYLDYEYNPTGKLTLQILYPPSEMHGQYRWNDTKKISLENRLNDALIGFILAAAWGREAEAQRKKRNEEWAREEAVREKRERRAAINKQRVINFKKGVEHWIQYREMSAFLEAVKESYRRTIDKNEDTGKWIQWAGKYLSNFQAISEDMIRYDVEEYQEKSTSWQANHDVQSETYNYWKRPWYQRKR
jgi:hypothetical protein